MPIPPANQGILYGATLTLTDGTTVRTADAINHSLRLLWEENLSALDSYESYLRQLVDGKNGEQYSILSTAGLRVSLVMQPHWEFVVTEVRCTHEWGALIVEYNDKPLAQVSGSIPVLVRPWKFREALPASFDYRPAPISIWDRSAGPRRAMIVLSGLLVWHR